jgi:phosphoglycerate dehydrogenase-like enzyme
MAMKPRVLMAVTPRQRAEIFSNDALAKLESITEVEYYQGAENMPREELLSRISRFQALITCWGSPRLDREVLERATLLRLVCHSAGSIRPYVCKEVFERGITVTNASSAIAVSVAETTIAFMLTSLRHLHNHNYRMRSDGGGRTEWGPVHELARRRVGLVGFGEVGRRVATLLKAFQCEILVYDPHRPPGEVEGAGCAPSSLDDLMKESDIVSIHASNIGANRHMIDGALLESMKEGALLVNTARGELIDEEAMLREVISGRIFVALDVFEAEASVVAAKLQESPNAFLTPHIAGMSVEARRRQGDVVAEDVARFFAGRPPRNLVTKEMLEWMA